MSSLNLRIGKVRVQLSGLPGCQRIEDTLDDIQQGVADLEDKHKLAMDCLEIILRVADPRCRPQLKEIASLIEAVKAGLE